MMKRYNGNIGKKIKIVHQNLPGVLSSLNKQTSMSNRLEARKLVGMYPLDISAAFNLVLKSILLVHWDCGGISSRSIDLPWLHPLDIHDGRLDEGGHERH